MICSVIGSLDTLLVKQPATNVKTASGLEQALSAVQSRDLGLEIARLVLYLLLVISILSLPFIQDHESRIQGPE